MCRVSSFSSLRSPERTTFAAFVPAYLVACVPSAVPSFAERRTRPFGILCSSEDMGPKANGAPCGLAEADCQPVFLYPHFADGRRTPQAEGRSARGFWVPRQPPHAPRGA